MFGDGPLSFYEFATREPHPLAIIQTAVLKFLRRRNDVALCGSQAVNAYVAETRLTEDVDVLALHAAQLAQELRVFLKGKFRMAIRVGELRNRLEFRVYQARRPKPRYLVDIRPIAELPPTKWVSQVQIVSPAEVIAGKVIVLHHRKQTPKSGTDWRDLALMLLTFPKLRADPGPVRDRLLHHGIGTEILDTWNQILERKISAGGEDDKFFW